MGFKRFRRKYGKFRPRRRVRRLSKRVKRTERRVKKLNDLIETKYRDYQTVGGGLSISALGLTVTPNGAGFWNELITASTQASRIGWEVYCSKLVLRFELTGASNYFDNIRLLVVKWKKFPPGSVLGTVPTIDNVIDTGGISPLIAPYAWINKDYFRVLYDKIHIVGLNATSSCYGVPPIIFRTKRFKLKCKTTYNSASNGILTNGIAIYAVSNSLVPPSPKIRVWGRLTYQDA